MLLYALRYNLKTDQERLYGSERMHFRRSNLSYSECDRIAGNILGWKLKIFGGNIIFDKKITVNMAYTNIIYLYRKENV